MNCTICGDTIATIQAGYGDVSEPICWGCWCELEDQNNEDFYGLAPHIHNLKKTGSYLGSTEFIKTPAPDENGWIDCSFMGPSWVGTWFKADEDDPSMGIYTCDPAH